MKLYNINFTMMHAVMVVYFIFLQNYCKPLMVREPVFHIKAGRHAVIESIQRGVSLLTC